MEHNCNNGSHVRDRTTYSTGNDGGGDGSDCSDDGDGNAQYGDDGDGNGRDGGDGSDDGDGGDDGDGRDDGDGDDNEDFAQCCFQYIGVLFSTPNYVWMHRHT